MEYHEFPFDACIRCTLCTISCPVSKVTDAYPGPKQMALELGRHRLHTNPIPAGALDYCANCKSCELSCPENIPIAHLIMTAKRQYGEQRRLTLRDRLLSRPALLGRLNAPVAPVTNAVFNIKPVRSLMEKTIGISRDAVFPKYSRPTRTAHLRAKNASARSVVYFTGCYAKYNDPSLIDATVAVLEHLGYDVLIPPQTCCGLSAMNNSDYGQAQKNAVFNTRSLLAAAGQDAAIVTSCTSCALTLKNDYTEVLDVASAGELALKIYDLSEFILKTQEEKGQNLQFGENSRVLGYHAPCHLKALGIGLPGLEVLRLIPGLTVKELDGGCCGSAGSYGFKAEKYAVSMEIGKNLSNTIAEASVPCIFTECPTCTVRIEQLTNKKVHHPVHLIADMLTGTEKYSS